MGIETRNAFFLSEFTGLDYDAQVRVQRLSFNEQQWQ